MLGLLSDLKNKLFKAFTTSGADSTYRPSFLTAPGTTSGLYKTTTTTNPGTALTTVFDIRGAGVLLILHLRKPATVNSVAVHYELTVDDVVLINDLVGTGANTAVQAGMVVGGQILAGAATGTVLAPVLMPFNKGIKLRVRYSGAPGASEDVLTDWLALYR